MQPFRAAIVPAETASKFANGIEIALEVGERKIPRRIVETFFARFTGRANREDARLNGCASVQAILAADFEQAHIALAVIEIPFERSGHGYDSGGTQHVRFFRERI